MAGDGFLKARRCNILLFGAICCAKDKKLSAQILKIDIRNNRDTILAFRLEIDKFSIYTNMLSNFLPAGT